MVNRVSPLSRVYFTLSLILSALSGSPPPPPRFLSSVIFRSFFRRDVNVSHKPTPGEGGGRRARADNPRFFFVCRIKCGSSSPPDASVPIERKVSARESHSALPHSSTDSLRVFVYDRSPCSPPTANKPTERGQTTSWLYFQQ